MNQSRGFIVHTFGTRRGVSALCCMLATRSGCGGEAPAALRTELEVTSQRGSCRVCAGLELLASLLKTTFYLNLQPGLRKTCLHCLVHATVRRLILKTNLRLRPHHTFIAPLTLAASLLPPQPLFLLCLCGTIVFVSLSSRAVCIVTIGSLFPYSQSYVVCTFHHHQLVSFDTDSINQLSSFLLAFILPKRLFYTLKHIILVNIVECYKSSENLS